jgi:trehalose 6-phosphate synthase
VWIGWSGAADRDLEPFGELALRLQPVPLSAAEVRGYYEGYANATLWPLYHDAIVPPQHEPGWWETYERVNRRFAEAAAHAAAPGAVVWVHDYHLQLVPAMLRESRPDLRIGFFLHIPFPPAELFARLPQRDQVLAGLLGADLVGFHLAGGAANFARLAARYVGARPRTPAQADTDTEYVLQVGERTVRAAAFPVSIDAAAFDRLARDPAILARGREIRAALGDPAKIVLGVDRLDYTKGIDVRLRALHSLLADGRVKPRDVVMVQIAAPSREGSGHYSRLRETIDREVGRINGEYGEIGRPVVHYLHTSIDQHELAALYSIADVMAVTPLRDGMNLVCKEYVASRIDLTGALVLSEFAGAAAELGSALIVNPHHLESVATGLANALTLDPAAERQRMCVMREHVMRFDATRWTRQYLDALDRVTTDYATSSPLAGPRSHLASA